MLGWQLLRMKMSDEIIIMKKERPFLHYTDADEEDEAPINNRLHSYELVENKFLNPKITLNLPMPREPFHKDGKVDTE
jgi:hypothetical protein